MGKSLVSCFFETQCTTTATATATTVVAAAATTTVYYYTRLTASFSGQHGYAGTRKVKPVWIKMRQEMMWFWHVSGISWIMCKQSAPRSRQITTPTTYRSIFTGRIRDGRGSISLHPTQPINLWTQPNSTHPLHTYVKFRHQHCRTRTFTCPLMK